MILVMDTAAPEAFIGLWKEGWKAKTSWEAGRNLSSQILEKLDDIYKEAGINLVETEKIIVNSGPGSYTGLRIGLSATNALAYSRNIPTVGIQAPENCEDLLNKGLIELKNLKTFNGSALPEYGSEPNITEPKKTF